MSNEQHHKLSFLAPKSVAIIGASAKPEKRGYQAIVRLLKDGFEQSRIFPIHPVTTEILGISTYRSVTEVEDAIDLALVCTSAKTLPEVIADCGRKGIPGAVILAAGMAESGQAGRKYQEAMLATAQQWGVRLVGPNTNGIFNLHCKLNIVGVPDLRKGTIGILSQSGNIMLGLTAEASENSRVGLSTYVGVGNQSDIALSEYLDYLGSDDNTCAVVIYVEGLKPGDGRRFLEVARRVVPAKPVVVYKSGRTVAGQLSVSSHTGSLAGSYRLTCDLLRQSGITLVTESDKMLSTAQALSDLPMPSGNRVAILCDSGGHGTMAADAVVEAGLELARLSAQSLQALASVLPSAAALNNPVDVAGGTDEEPDVFARCVDILLTDDQVDILVLVGMIGAYSLRFSPTLLDSELETSRRITRLVSQHNKPVIVQCVYQQKQPEPLTLLSEQGIPVFTWVETAVHCARELVRYADACRRLQSQHPIPDPTPLPQGQAVFAKARSEGRTALLETEARDLLRIYGVDVPADYIVHCERDLDQLPADFVDQPVAMKIVSQDVLHKTDSGGVKLNIEGKTEQRNAYHEILANAREYTPDAVIEGVLVTPMLSPGVEVILGVTRDPNFGPVMMFGLGGIFVELLKDVVFRAIPLSPDDADEMIQQIRSAQMLNGARGSKPVDRDALIALIMQLSSLVWKHPQIAELDLNPVIAREDGCAIADARIILTEQDDD